MRVDLSSHTIRAIAKSREAYHAAPKDYASRFVQEQPAETVAKSAELAALLADQTNGGE